MNETTSHKVLELFEKHRKESRAEFDHSHFFDFLIKQPKEKGSFRNSFSGLRRFNAFWDDIQLEFGICFSIKDREIEYSLDDFCARIEQLKKSRRSSKASLKNRAKYGFEWSIFVFANALLISFAFAFSSINLLAAATWLGIAFLNYKLIHGYWKEIRYIKELEVKILNEENI